MTFTANDMVTVLTAVGVLFTIIGGLIVNIIMARRTQLATQKTQVEVEDIVGKTDIQTNKLENIEILVDGRYSAVLQELANVKKLLAESSGLAHHLRNAEIAQTVANEQETRVDMLKGAKNSSVKNENDIPGSIPVGPILDVPLLSEDEKDK